MSRHLIKNLYFLIGSLPKHVLDLEESYKMYMHMERKAWISEQLETLQERSFGRRKRSDRSENDEAAQDSPPQKAPACSGMRYQVQILV